jgi:DNA-binding MarR family transcriptional regulator
VNDSSAVSAAGELLDATGLLRRTIRRSLRQVSAAEPLPATHCELLRLADSRPGITVADAAAELHLAPNTVSTMVSKLTRDGLLRRSRDANDGRIAQLTITPAARQRLAERRDLRAEVAGRAFFRLSPADRRALAAAVPALLRLAEGVQASDWAA